jgi:hypothetical protein
VVDSENVYLRISDESVYNAVGSVNDLAKPRVRELRDLAPRLGKRTKAFRGEHEPPDDNVGEVR